MSLYKLINTNSSNLNKISITFDKNIPSKLIKFGFNNITEEIDIIKLTSNNNYKIGLEYNFDDKNEYSIFNKINNLMNIKNSNQNIAEIWEIFYVFNFLNKSQKIYTSHDLSNIINFYKKITGNNNDHKIVSKDATLIFFKFSDIEIDENVVVQMILKNLDNLFNIQEKDSVMILQISNIQTLVMIQLLYFLCFYYNEAYIFKPSIISDLFDNKYIILIGYKNNYKENKIKLKNNLYPVNLGIDNIDDIFLKNIQCINSSIIPTKIKRYYLIKNYLDIKIYEGNINEEMIENQKKNAINWIKIYSNNPQNDKLIDKYLNFSDNYCKNFYNFDIFEN